MAGIEDFLSENEQAPEAQAPLENSGVSAWMSGSDESSRLGFAVSQGMSADPDRSARVIKMQQKTGLAPDLVDRNLETIESESTKSDFDPQKFRQKSPVVAGWMAESPNHAAAVRDDLDNLQKIEKTVQDHGFLSSMGSALISGINKMWATAAKAPALVYDVAALPQNLAAKALDRPDLQVRAPEWLRDNPVAKYYDRNAEMNRPPEMDQSISEEIKKGNYSEAGRTLAIQFAANAPQQAAIIAGTLMGYGLPTLAGAGVMTASDSAAEAAKEGADPASATTNALTQGTIEAAFERLGTFGILKHWEGQIAKQWGKQVSTEVMKDFGKTLAYSVAGEANEEFMTSVGQDLSSYITGVNPNALEGIGQRAIDAGILGGTSGGAMTAPSAIGSGIRRAQQVRQTGMAKDFYTSLGESVEASKVRERLPEQTKAIVENLVKDSPVENIYIPTEAFDSYFQGAQQNPVSIVQNLGLIENYNEAKETGADIKIPLAAWVDKVVGTEYYQGLQNDIKFSPEAMTVNEAVAERKAVQSQIQDVESQNAEITPVQSSADLVAADVEAKILAAQIPGIDESKARTYAKTMSAFFGSVGQRTGMDAKELYDRYGLQVNSADAPVQQVIDGTTFNQAAPALPAPTQSPLGFYSQVETELTKMDFKSIPPADLAGRLKNLPGIKQEEMEVLGLQEWLAAKEGKVTKEEVLDFVRANGVQVEQIVMSEDFGGDSGTGVGEIEWDEPSRDRSGESDDISSEMDYYIDSPEDAFGEETLAEWKAEAEKENTNEEGEIDEEAAKEAYEEKIREEAEKRATEYVESDEYHGARFSVDTNIRTGRFGYYSLHGSDEVGWYSYDFNKSFDGNLEEAKIQFAGLLLEKGIIEGNRAQLIKAQEIDWKKPTAAKYPSQASITKRANQLIKSDYARLEAKAKEEESWRFDEVDGEEINYKTKSNRAALKKAIESVARDEAEAYYKDHTNPKNTVKVSIEHAILSGYIEGNDKKGYRLNYESQDVENNRFDLDSKTLDEAKKEAIAKIVANGDAVAAPTADPDADVNTPSGKSKWSKYRVDGGENYREILLTLPKVGPEKFSYRTHFDQENIVAHVRLTDRQDTDGRKVLFVEELQSDWHQQGREKGYKSEDLEALKSQRRELEHRIENDVNLTEEETAALSEQRKNLTDQIAGFEDAVPDAPFKNTEAWAALAMKRIVRLAVEQGYEAVAWTPGSVHVERWGTDSISWVKKDGVNILDPDGFLLGTTSTEDEAREFLGRVTSKEDDLSTYKIEKGPHWLVGSVEQIGGNADGVNIEDMARRRGELLERRGERVASKEKLKEVITETLGRERNDRSLESLTDSIWKQMQEKDSGVKAPRKEGMEFFYDNVLPKKVMPAIMKKLDKEAKVTVGEIKTDEDETMKVWEIPLSEAAVEKAKEGFTLFQGQPADPRGRIQFGKDRKFSIDLFKHFDLSTFLHEAGHFYMEVMGDVASTESAPQQLKDDYKVILDWLGVETRDQIQTEHHEKWARGFEAYLMEGKSPSEALRAVFARIRTWLVSIYRQISALDVELTPEVRSVMDRMMATQEEIDAVYSTQQIEPLFPDPQAVGMNEAEAEKYQKAILEARQAAEEGLSKKLMDEHRRAQLEWWKSERDGIRSDIEAEVNEQPVYVALAVLQKGTQPDGSPLPEGLAPFKLSREAIVREFGKERLKQLPRPYVHTKEGGLAPDTVAGMFGFSSGDEFLTAISTAEDRVALIDRLADEKMKQLHGDFLTDGRLPEEAMKAVHSEKRSQLLRAELQHLASNNLASLKGIIRTVAKRIPTIDSVRKQAEETVAKKRARDISPNLYQRAENKARKAAVEAMLKGDMDLAFSEKQKELLNHELYRAATAARENIDSLVDYMGKFAKPSTRERIGKAGADYLEQIDSIIERFDFRRSISLKAVDKRKSLLEWVQEQAELGLPVEVPQRLLQEANRGHYKDQTYQDLLDIQETVENIEHLARTKNRLLKSVRARELQEAVTEIVGSITANHDVQPEPLDFAPTMRKKIFSSAKAKFGSHIKPEFLFEYLDGNREMGPVWQYMFRPFVEAEAQETKMLAEVSAKIEEILSVYPRKERAKWFYQKQHLPEINTHMTKANMLSVALNWGNQYNRDALMKGYGWNESQVQAILGRLNEADWKMIQEMWDYIDTFWPAIQKMERNLNGVAPAKVEATAVQTRFGTFRGGYYPIIFDSKLSQIQARREEKAQVQDLFGGNWARAMTKKGHTKSRTDTGGKPLKLELSGISQHLYNVVHDLSFREAIIDVNRLVEHPEVRATIEATAGRELYKQINPWLVSMAGDRPQDSSNSMENLLGRARMSATVVNMGFKATTAIMQLSGYPVAMKELGPKYALRGIKDFVANPTKIKAQWDFVMERSQMMRNRGEAFDRDVRDMVRTIDPVEAKTAHIRTAFLYHIGAMDKTISTAAWMGAYKKAMEGAVDAIEKGDENAAVAYADKLIRQTQGSGGAKDLAAVQRGSNAWKLFTMFYTPFSVLFNQFAKTGSQYSFDRNLPKLMWSLSMLWFLPAVLDDLLVGRGPDDDEEPEEWIRWFLKKESLYPFQSVVIVRDVINGMGEFGYEPSAAFNAFESVARSGKLGLNLAIGDQDEVTRNDLKGLVNTAGYLTGLPSRQVWLTSEYMHDWMTGEEAPESPYEGIWRSFVTGKPRD